MRSPTQSTCVFVFYCIPFLAVPIKHPSEMPFFEQEAASSPQGFRPQLGRGRSQPCSGFQFLCVMDEVSLNRLEFVRILLCLPQWTNIRSHTFQMGKHRTKRVKLFLQLTGIKKKKKKDSSSTVIKCYQALLQLCGLDQNRRLWGGNCVPSW